MEGSSRNRRRSPPGAGSHSDTNNGSSSSSNAMLDSATNMAATVQTSPADNDNGDPSSGSRISSPSSLHSHITNPSSLTIPSGSAQHGNHAMPEVKGDNQRPTQNTMPIEFILRNSPPPNDFSGSSNTVDVSTANGKQSGSTASGSKGMISEASPNCPPR